MLIGKDRIPLSHARLARGFLIEPQSITCIVDLLSNRTPRLLECAIVFRAIRAPSLTVMHFKILPAQVLPNTDTHCFWVCHDQP